MSSQNDTSSARENVRNSIREASRWESLGGQSQLTMHYMSNTERSLFEYPRNMQIDNEINAQLGYIQKDQACIARMEVERLLAIVYAQKARLESQETRDNWAGDCLGIVDANIRALKRCHNTLRLASQTYNY